MRGLALTWIGAGVLAACNVPLEHYASPDAPRDASPDTDAGGTGPGMLAQRAYLKASNTDAGDGFGHAVALSADGSTLAVGAIHEASSSGANPASNADMDAGAVYVFRRSGQTWTQEAYVKAPHPDPDDFFGHAVALSADGSTLAIGAVSEDSKATGVGGDQTDNNAPAAGAVYVFTRTGTAWALEAYVKASNTGGGDAFGQSVALSADGSTLAVGASLEDSDGTTQASSGAQDSGAVYVFTRTGGLWSQQAYVKAPIVNSFDGFGASVALSDDGATLAVGASFADSAMTNLGAVHVFARTGTTWTPELDQVGTGNDPIGALGNSVALSGDGATLAVGASREDSVSLPAQTTSGAVYLFTRSGATWTQAAHLEASIVGAGDRFGTSVSLSHDGARLLIGAPAEDGRATGLGGDPADDTAPDAGAAYLFVRSGATWSQGLYLKASNTDAGDGFGASVALSADAATLAVGADAEASKARGVDGDETDDTAGGAGAAYVFR
ncbi:MAG TPA: hypothetical protein VFK02_03935 [Kofleriaceae bacterium]|nr:hypothetical protein [Kofleriaceae bacterium]